MDYIERISNRYDGQILLHAPYIGKIYENIPQQLYSILRISNGITETMRLSDTNEKIEIGWILYSHEMIMEWTSFYATHYRIKGSIFSDDGADCVYCIKTDGTITCFDSTDNNEIQIADTLWDFFGDNSGLSV